MKRKKNGGDIKTGWVSGPGHKKLLGGVIRSPSESLTMGGGTWGTGFFLLGDKGKLGRKTGGSCRLVENRKTGTKSGEEKGKLGYMRGGEV